jgi:hypothetical protein
MARCEDYPCCGHTDGLPCDWTPPAGPHAFCDHENDICEVSDDGLGYDPDDDEE